MLGAEVLKIIRHVNNTYRKKDIKDFDITPFLHYIVNTTLIKSKNNV